MQTKAKRAAEAPARRTSEVIRAEQRQLEADGAAAAARLSELEAGYDVAVLAGDEAAEANEASQAVAKRSIRRAELRGADLLVELEQATARELEELAEAKRKSATAAVNAVLARMHADYEAPSARIAEFLAAYQEAHELALEAGVATPHDHLRVRPGRFHAAHDETFEVYVDEQGVETAHPYPPGAYQRDLQGRYLNPNNTRELMPMRPRRTKTRHVPERREPDLSLPHLPSLVALPGLRIDDPTHWHGDRIVRKEGR